MKSFRAFTILLVTTITLASAALEVARFGFIELRLIAGLVLLYAASIRIRESFYRSETTFFDADHGVRDAVTAKEELIVFGHGIEDLAHESKERRLLMDLVDFGGKRYLIYLAWAASVALAIGLQSRFRPTTFLDVMIPLLILSSITFSPFLAQLLMPAAVSLGIALLALVRSDSLYVSFYFFLFAISFFLTLYLYREVTPDRLNPERNTRLATILKTACVISVLFIGLYNILDFIVPEENPFKRGASAVVRKPKKFSTENVSRELAEQILKFQDRRRGGSPGGERGDSSGAERGENRSGEARGEPGGGRSGDGPSGGGGDQGEAGSTDGQPGGRSTERKEALREARGAELRDVPNGKGDHDGSNSNSRADYEPRDGRGDPRSSDHDRSTERPSDDHRVSDRGRSREPREGSGSHEPGGGTNRVGDHGRGIGHGDGDGTGKGDRGAAKNTPPSPDGDMTVGRKDPLTHAKETAVERKQKIDEIQRKVELPVQLGKALLFLIVAGVVLLFIFKFFTGRKEEDEDGIKMQQLTKRQKQKLQSVLHQIRSRRLSADAEVIETYNALLAVFEMGRHPRDEWLPAEDFSRKIGETIPTLSKPFESATKRFSRTLYGRKDVRPEELGIFREDVGRILHFFQVN